MYTSVATSGPLSDPRQPARLPVERIETIPVVAPLATTFQGSHYRMTNRATLIIRVYAQGLVGEAYVGDEDQTLAAIERVVHEEIVPQVGGLDASRINAAWEASYPVTFDILRDRRTGLVALAALDSALWDLLGKSLHMPLWRLWGGAADRRPMIAIGGYYGEPLGRIEDEMLAYRELGLAGVKFKVGGADPREDADRVRRARSAAGDDFIIAIDANQGYTLREASALARLVQDLDIAWFEEPVRWSNDAREMRDLRLGTGIAVCAGQSELSPAGCRDLMEQGAIDICNFDASWSGGPTAWLRAAAVANVYGVRMGHHEEPQIASHLVASQPGGSCVECFHPVRDPFWWSLIANRPALVDGQLPLGDAPGLGWELDWDFVKRYRVNG